jgi:hypothetical protein
VIGRSDIVFGRPNAEGVEQRARLMEIGSKYTLHMRVIDTLGNEVLNLTKPTLGRDLHDNGDAFRNS